MNVKRVLCVAAILASLVGNELSAAVVITTPPNGLSSPSMTKEVYGTASPNSSNFVNVNRIPVGGGTMSYIGGGFGYPGSGTDWVATVGLGVWIDKATYIYTANSYVPYPTLSYTKAVNYCTIP